MDMKKILPVLLMLISMLMGCNRSRSGFDEQAYADSLTRWHQQRVADLKRSDGWVNLAGLYWLKEGMNSFGSDPVLDVVFPPSFAIPRAGYFMMQNGVVSMLTDPDQGITTDGQQRSEVLFFHPDSATAMIAEKGSFRWNIIRRKDQLGVRLRDLNNPALAAFTEPERFPVTPELRLEASLIPADSLHTILITNVLGQTTPERSPGKLTFTIDGQPFTLDALESGADLFIIFADATTGIETYGGGRFLYVPKPGPDGRVVLDFNKAINPPCVFTPYATCPLPPAPNRLSVAIRAGEKDYHH